MIDNACLVIEAEKSGSRWRVTAKLGGEVVHIDTIDLASAPQRDRFAKALHKKAAAADPEAVEAELVRLSAARDARGEDAARCNTEIDISRLIRPEMFHSGEVSGFAVPIVVEEVGAVVPKWLWLLRWADGRREVRDVDCRLVLADGKTLLVNPVPSPPPIQAAAGWSRAGRDEWLKGAAGSTASEVFKDLCKLVNDHVEFPSESAQGMIATMALWVILTYVFRAWGAVPYLYVGGPMGSGKSKLFEVLGHLVFRPTSTSNMTAAALFRTQNSEGGTVLADEAERLKGREPEVMELKSMFLAGYKRGGTATRLKAFGDTFRTVHFDVYGPKALACIAGLPAPLLSRCIPVMMCRASPGSEKPGRAIDPGAWNRGDRRVTDCTRWP